MISEKKVSVKKNAILFNCLIEALNLTQFIFSFDQMNSHRRFQK